jgi:antitoxin HicB
MAGLYKIPLVLSPQPEGGYTVICPLLPELVTEGDTVEGVLSNVRDALSAVLELYRDLNKPLPDGLQQSADGGPVWLETLVGAP